MEWRQTRRVMDMLMTSVNCYEHNGRVTDAAYSDGDSAPLIIVLITCCIDDLTTGYVLCTS